MPRATGSTFQLAVDDSKKLKSKPSNDDLLALYGLYKQATQDPPIKDAEALGMFDLKGKAKRGAWKKVDDAGITPEQAEEKYVELVNKMKETYGYDPDKVPETVGSS